MSFVKSILNHRNCNYCHHRNQTIKFRSLHSHCHLKIINAASVNMSDHLKILCSSNYAFDKITAYNGGRDSYQCTLHPLSKSRDERSRISIRQSGYRDCESCPLALAEMSHPTLVLMNVSIILYYKIILFENHLEHFNM